MQTFSSRDFNREPGRIKRAAVDGPVIITERGRPIIAVMPFAEYERLKAPPGNILDALDMDEVHAHVARQREEAAAAAGQPAGSRDSTQDGTQIPDF